MTARRRRADKSTSRSNDASNQLSIYADGSAADSITKQSSNINESLDLLEFVQDPVHESYIALSRYRIVDNQIRKQSNKQSSDGSGSQSINQSFLQSVQHSVASTLMSVFLPVNYPHSVTRDYVAYQVCDTLQGLTSYLRSLICMNSLMTGMGVGAAEKTSVNATLMWVTRDGCGLFGSLLFGYAFSEGFGQNVKRFRLFADIINDVGLFLELISPRFEGYFLLFACLGTICRALCGVSAGATRGAILSHFARANNAADLNAKEGMQETAVTLIGMTMGWGVLKMIDQSNDQSKEQSNNQLIITWIIFTLLTIVHVWANVVAMNSLVFTSIDRSRGQLLMEDFINQSIHQSKKTSKNSKSQPVQVMTPEQVNNKQWIMPFPTIKLLTSLLANRPFDIEMGCRITQVDPNILSLMISQSNKQAIGQSMPYLFVPSFLPDSLDSTSKPKIFVLLKNDPSTNQSVTQLQPVLASALFHAILFSSKYSTTKQLAKSSKIQSINQSIEDIYSECLTEGETLLPQFLDTLAARGWDTSRWTIPCGKYRYQW